MLPMYVPDFISGLLPLLSPDPDPSSLALGPPGNLLDDLLWDPFLSTLPAPCLCQPSLIGGVLYRE